MVGVLVISPYPSVRAGLRALLQASSDIEVAWEAAGATDLADPWPLRPDVALVDGAAGREVVDALAARVPDLPVIVLGAEASRGRDAGHVAARGYLTHDANAEELAAAVHAVARGLTVIDPALVQGLLGGPSSSRAMTGEPNAEPLTPRELEVLQLLAAGLPNKTIASQLHISEHTAKFHVSSVLSKLHAASRTEAVTLAARRGLLLL